MRVSASIDHLCLDNTILNFEKTNFAAHTFLSQTLGIIRIVKGYSFTSTSITVIHDLLKITSIFHRK
jgi:hypothetical protein